MRATTSRPDVPWSRRWTMPGRSGSPTRGHLRVAGEQAVDERARRAARRRGARPARPACRPRARRRPRGRPRTATLGSGSGERPARAAAPTSTDERLARRCTRCLPAVDHAAVERHRAGRHERARPRSGCTPAEQADDAVDPLAVERRRDRLDHGPDRPRSDVLPATGQHRADHQDHAADHDGHVGHVEHRPPLEVDEVDDRAAEEAVAGPEEPVEQVAEGAAEDEADADGRRASSRCAAATPAATTMTTRATTPMNGPTPAALAEGHAAVERRG